MKASVYITIGVALACCVLWPGVVHAALYQGHLDGEGLTVFGDKWTTGTPEAKVEWWVTDEEDPPKGFATFVWKYTYKLTVPQGAPSHIIVEASDEEGKLFTAANLTAVTGSETQEIQTHTAGGGGNPNMPENEYGIKFEDMAEATVITITFYSDRDPIWGDFYAKDGGNNPVNSLYNTGFTADDPDLADYPLGDGSSVLNHLLVPDTIPEPATMGLLALGGLALLRRKKNLS